VEPRNPATTAFAGARAPVDLRAAYAFARELARRSPEEVGGAGHRLFWIRGAAYGGRFLPAREDAFGVAGRHTQCDVVLFDEPSIALRHLLVRSIPVSGGVALRVLDLHTELGFSLSDGSRQTSIFAEGAVALRVGDVAVVALPSDEPAPPPELPAAEVLEHPYRANARPPRHSRITLMPRLMRMGDPAPPRLSRLAGGDVAIALERDGRRAEARLSLDDLVGGVVIGRSLKCHSETLRRITDHNTSRVHVLLLREGATAAAYDLASTQGTYDARGLRVRRVDLGPATTLHLGRGDAAVRLTWRV